MTASLASTNRPSVYVVGARADIHRIRRWATALGALPTLQVSWGACDKIVRPSPLIREDRLGAGHHPTRAIFAGLRRAAIAWILWPDGALCEGVIGALAYALAHRWHVGPRLGILVSGADVEKSLLAQAADGCVLDDVLAFEICRKRLRFGTWPAPV